MLSFYGIYSVILAADNLAIFIFNSNVALKGVGVSITSPRVRLDL